MVEQTESRVVSLTDLVREAWDQGHNPLLGGGQSLDATPMAVIDQSQPIVNPAGAEHTTEVKRTSRPRKLLASAAAVVALAAGGFLAINSDKGEPVATAPIPEATPATPLKGAISKDVIGSLHLEDDEAGMNVPLQLASVFEDVEVAVGENVNWTQRTELRGANSFDFETTRTKEQLVAQMNGSDEAAVAARESMINELRENGMDQAGIDRVLSGKGHIAVQALEPVIVHGNTYYKDGKVIESAERAVPVKGDVYWMYFDEQGNVVPEASSRADCDNNRVIKVTKYDEHKPDVPNIVIPPKAPETPTPTTVPEVTTTTGVTTTTEGTTTTEATTTTSTTEATTTTTTTEDTTTTTLKVHPPADGPPKEATIPPQPQDPTQGYESGNAEEVVEQQESEVPGGLEPTEHGTPAPEGSPSGNDQIVETPGEDAPDNPEYEPGTESSGTDEGVSDEGRPESETDHSGETSEHTEEPLPLDPLESRRNTLGGLVGGLVGGLALYEFDNKMRRFTSTPGNGLDSLDITLED